MDFMKAMLVAVSVIREQRELDEIYLYEPNKQVRVYLKDYEGGLNFKERNIYLAEQVFLGGIVDNRIVKKQLSLDTLFSASWEVRLQKKSHLSAIPKQLSKEEFIDYAPVNKEEVADV